MESPTLLSGSVGSGPRTLSDKKQSLIFTNGQNREVGVVQSGFKYHLLGMLHQKR